MKITLFKKQNEPRIELIEKLIDELDQLKDDLWGYDLEDHTLKMKTFDSFGNEKYFRQIQDIKERISLRENIITNLLK